MDRHTTTPTEVDHVDWANGFIAGGYRETFGNADGGGDDESWMLARMDVPLAQALLTVWRAEVTEPGFNQPSKSPLLVQDVEEMLGSEGLGGRGEVGQVPPGGEVVASFPRREKGLGTSFCDALCQAAQPPSLGGSVYLHMVQQCHKAFAVGSG